MEIDENGLNNEAKAKRFTKLVEATTKNGNRFAKMIGMSQSSVNRAMLHGIGVTPKLIEHIAIRFKNINPAWLLAGSGEMFFPEKMDQLNDPETPYNYNKEGMHGLVDMTSFIRDLHHLKLKMAALELEVAALREENKALRGLAVQGQNRDIDDDKPRGK